MSSQIRPKATSPEFQPRHRRKGRGRIQCLHSKTLFFKDRSTLGTSVSLNNLLLIDPSINQDSSWTVKFSVTLCRASASTVL